MQASLILWVQTADNVQETDTGRNDFEVRRVQIDQAAFEETIEQIKADKSKATSIAHKTAEDPLNSLERTIFRHRLLSIYQQYRPAQPTYEYIALYRSQLHAKTRSLEDLKKERPLEAWYEAVRVSCQPFSRDHELNVLIDLH